MVKIKQPSTADLHTLLPIHPLEHDYHSFQENSYSDDLTSALEIPKELEKSVWTNLVANNSHQ